MSDIYFICPECQMEIDYLEIVERCTSVRFGTVDMYGSNYDFVDEETDDVDFECYKCPECRFETHNVEDFHIEMTEEERIEYEKEQGIYIPSTPPKPQILTYFNKEVVDDI